MKKEKTKKIKFLHQKPITEDALYKMRKRVNDWHEFFYTKVFLTLTRNI